MHISFEGIFARKSSTSQAACTCEKSARVCCVCVCVLVHPRKCNTHTGAVGKTCTWKFSSSCIHPCFSPHLRAPAPSPAAAKRGEEAFGKQQKVSFRYPSAQHTCQKLTFEILCLFAPVFVQGWHYLPLGTRKCAFCECVRNQLKLGQLANTATNRRSKANATINP